MHSPPNSLSVALPITIFNMLHLLCASALLSLVFDVAMLLPKNKHP